MSDGELIVAVRRGDADAWRELYTRWMPWVWRYAYALVQDPHVAEDVTSETMTAWVRSVDSTGDDAPQVAAWLRSVIRHKAADHHRRLSRFRRAADGLSRISDDCDSRQPEEQLERSETRGQVLQALDRLKDTHRTVIEWKYAEGMSVREIASRLGVTEKATEANLYRARREFRRQFQSLQPSDEHSAEQAPPDSENAWQDVISKSVP